jgi:hypothetical protein
MPSLSLPFLPKDDHIIMARDELVDIKIVF